MTTFYMDFENGTDGDFKDHSPIDRILSANNMALLQTNTVSKFGGRSLKFPGDTATVSHNGINLGVSSNFDFGLGDFTVEFWINPIAFTNNWATLFGNLNTTYVGGCRAIMMPSGTHKIHLVGAGNTDALTTTVLDIGTWYHIAFSKQSSTMRVFTNGVLEYSANDQYNHDFSAAGSALGAALGYNGWDGTNSRLAAYVDDLRITKGVARYTANFTAPTGPLPHTAAGDPYFNNVVLLAHFDEDSTVTSGTTFGRRWKTLTNGATAARIAPGDVIRVMGSPDPTPLGYATWTQYSKNVTLAASVTQMVSDCETAWTASANATVTADTSLFKENTKSMKAVIATAFTTGKVAYLATGTLDLSGYQQISYWVYNTVAVAANTLSLRLCTDAAGAVPVHTIPIPAIPSTGQWVPVTVDLGTGMNAAIASVALYQDVDIAAVTIQIDNIIACKAPTATDSLTLTSLIGKVCNLSWSASTTYATGDERKPTQPNRNGFRYRATTGGITGAVEPAWPQGIGATVVDGAVTWTCVGAEDTWYGIQSINGTVVKLDNHVNCAGNAGRGYSGATETVATYKRETVKTAMASASTSTVMALQDAGTDGNPILFSGGWSRTDMSTQTGETWLDGQNGHGYAIHCNSKAHNTLVNLNGVRYNGGIYDLTTGTLIRNSHWDNDTSYGIAWVGSTPVGAKVIGAVCNNGGGSAFFCNNPGVLWLTAVAGESNLGYGVRNTFQRADIIPVHGWFRNNTAYGISNQSQMPLKAWNIVTGNNGNGGVSMDISTDNVLVNCLLPETTPINLIAAICDAVAYSQKHNQIADNHLITTDGGTIISATDQRHSPTGISWKFRPTATSRNSFYPLKLTVAKIACKANTPVAVTIWTRRDSTNIRGRLFLAGGQIAGVPADIAIDCTPAINGWAVSDTLNFTPTETGVVEIQFRVWDGVGTTNNFWIDDISIS